MLQSVLSLGRWGLFILAATILLQGMARDAVAEPMRCPQRLAFVDNDPLTQREAESLKAIYARIGCPDVTFVGLPGRRGVTAFNTGDVQGELMRLPAVEVEYTRPFLRVASPVNHVVGRLWARSVPGQGAPGPFGFVLGVVWQEQYG
ncbi:MAG: hypothetical protein ACAH24_15080, partial [Hyphomicrobiaceae bacterium]